MGEKDDTGMTPLLAAIERGNQDAAALLLIHGADIDAIDGGGRGVMDLPQCPPKIREYFSELWNLGEDDADETDVSFAWEAPWCPRLNWMWPPRFREAVHALLMCSRHGRSINRSRSSRSSARGEDEDVPEPGRHHHHHHHLGVERKGEEKVDDDDDDDVGDDVGDDVDEDMSPPPLGWLDEQCVQLIIRHMSRPVGAWV